MTERETERLLSETLHAQGGMAEFLARMLAAAGLTLVPVEPDDAAVEDVARKIYEMPLGPTSDEQWANLWQCQLHRPILEGKARAAIRRYVGRGEG